MNRSSLRARSFDRILLIKPSAFGDVLHTIPVLVKLRQRYPTARIDWLITPENADLVRHHPALSHVVPFDRKLLARFGRSWYATGELCRLLASLWKPRYDLVIDLHGQFRSALLTLATRARVRIGFDRPSRQVWAPGRPVEAYRHGWTGAREGAWLVYSHRIRVTTLEAHAVDRYLWLGPLLDLPDGPPDFTIHSHPDDDDRAGRLLQSSGLDGRRFAVLFPGTVWPTKHWHAEGFAAVGRHLLASHRAVLVCGGPGDRERCRQVTLACEGAVDLCGKTSIAEVVSIVRRADVCVTNDSGPMHLAVSLDRPVVSVFGPTDAVWIGPYGRPSSVVRAGLDCSPCYLRQVHDCPHDHDCMKRVSAEMVIERLSDLMGRQSEPRAAA